MRLRRKQDPPVPVNVRLVTSRGEIPVDCVYVGIKHGVHMWDAIVHGSWIEFDADGNQISRIACDVLPAKTGISVAIR